MKRLLAAGKWVLLVYGGLSLLATLVIIGLFVYWTGVGNRTKKDQVSPHDVRFVLNWCRLGDKRIEKVIHSHVSARSFTGDHLDAYAIKITNITLDELTANTNDFTGRWYRGDQMPKVLDDAVAFAGSWIGTDDLAWFPNESELRSREIYVYPWSIYCHGVMPSAVEIIFIRPKDKMVFFISAKS
jgi:hypothetical protein